MRIRSGRPREHDDLLDCSAAPLSIKRAAIDPPADALSLMTLSSGLRVMLERDRDASLVGVVTVVGVGGASDPEHDEGLAHLVEHLTFRSKAMANGRTVSERLRALGAIQVNGHTAFDFTTFQSFALPDVWERLVAVEAQRLLDPLAGVDEAAFEIERRAVLTEVRYHDEHGQAGLTDGSTEAGLTRVTLADA